jgi:hypothetical protein
MNGESIEDFKFTRRQVNYEWGIYWGLQVYKETGKLMNGESIEDFKFTKRQVNWWMGNLLRTSSSQGDRSHFYLLHIHRCTISCHEKISLDSSL